MLSLSGLGKKLNEYGGDIGRLFGGAVNETNHTIQNFFGIKPQPTQLPPPTPQNPTNPSSLLNGLVRTSPLNSLGQVLEPLGRSISQGADKASVALNKLDNNYSLPVVGNVADLATGFVKSPAETLMRSGQAFQGKNPYQGMDLTSASGTALIDALNIVTAGRGGALSKAGEKLAAPVTNKITNKIVSDAARRVIGTTASTTPISAAYGGANVLASGNSDPLDVAKGTLLNAAAGPVAGVLHGGIPLTYQGGKAVVRKVNQQGEGGYLNVGGKDNTNDLAAQLNERIAQNGILRGLKQAPVSDKINAQAAPTGVNVTTRTLHFDPKVLQGDLDHLSSGKGIELPSGEILRKAPGQSNADIHARYLDELVKFEESHVTGATLEDAMKIRSGETTAKQLDEKAVEGAKPKVAFQPREEPLQLSKKDPQVKELLEGIAKARGTGQVEQQLVSSSIRQKARELGVKIDHDSGFIDRYQTGTIKTAAEKEMADFIKQATDRTFKRQQQLSPEIEYRSNYLPQAYKEFESPNSGAVGFRTKTDAAKQRKFDTYGEAAQYGYNSKYDSVDKMVGVNAGSARSAAGHADVINRGLESGVFTPTSGEGRAPLTGFYSPMGDQLYAPKNVADIINGTLQRDTNGFAKAAHVAAKTSSTMQDIGLQGGIPGTPANFFTAGLAIKDTTRNIGKFGLHPIQAVKQEAAMVKDFLTGTNSMQKRFAENSDFIRSMADRGLFITHQSPLHGQGENIVKRGWNAVGNDPTFGRYMPNRLLTTSLEVYNQSVGKLGKDKALDLAAETTKAFNGITDQVAKGRSNLTQDMMTAGLFAPKYRESIINTLSNVVKSVADPRTYGNKAYNPSRELFAGMMLTLYAYNELNKKFNNGQNMWQNPKGQETNLQIPYGEKDDKGNQPVMRIPFMPGFLTIPRVLWSAGSAASQGDVKGVVAQTGRLTSMPINTATALIGNQDYFGRPIYNDQAVADANGNEPDDKATVAKKVAGYVIGQSTPGWVRAGINQAEGKPLEQNVAAALEAPVRFGKVTNPETTEYFNNRKEFYTSLNKNERSLFDKLNPTAKDNNGESIKEAKNSLTKSSDYSDLLAHPEFASKYVGYMQSQAKHDPLWDLQPDQLRAYMQAQVISKNDPGGDSKTVSALYDRLPGDFFTKREEFFASLKSKGVDVAEASAGSARPKMSDDLVKFSENYHNLPYGTGARAAALRSSTGQAYIAFLNQNRVYNNQERADLGLPPLEDTSSQYSKNSSKSYAKLRTVSSGSGSSPGKPKKAKVGLKSGGSGIRLARGGGKKPTVKMRKSQV